MFNVSRSLFKGSRSSFDEGKYAKKQSKRLFCSYNVGGSFIGFGVMLAYTIGGLLSGTPYVRVVMGLSFGIALSLVVIAGAEFFTGNIFVMMSGALAYTTQWTDAIKIWMVCLIGNWVGALILALVFTGTGLVQGSGAEYFVTSAVSKTLIPPGELFLRGMLCNTLVCLAIWSTYRTKSDAAKLMMGFGVCLRLLL